jgi:hypothetical protein
MLSAQDLVFGSFIVVDHQGFTRARMFIGATSKFSIHVVDSLFSICPLLR